MFNQQIKYFYYVTQPITFLADTTEGNSGVVNLRVGVIEEISSGSPVGGGNLNNTTDKMAGENRNNVLATKGAKERKQNLVRKNSLEKNKIKDREEESANGGPPSDDPTTFCFYGEFISSPFKDAYVVVEVECDTTRPLLLEDYKNLVVTNVNGAMFNVTNEIDNHSNCKSETQDRGGWAISESYPSHLPTGNKNTYNYITEMKFEMSWGICSDKINDIYHNPRMVDITENNRVTNIHNIDEASDAIEDFITSIPKEGYGFTEQINYYPLPKTTYHELKHISQYKDSLNVYYDKALYQINWMEAPPFDYCDPSKLLQVLEEREDKFENFLKEAGDEFINSHTTNKNQYENEAYETGHNYVIDVMIPLLKEYIKNPY